MTVALGIDFGATATKAALIRDGRAELITQDGRADLPGAVLVPDQGDLRPVRVGDPQAAPGRTIALVKRLLGRTWEDPEVRAVDAAVGYRLARAADGSVNIHVDGQELAPVQIVATLLRHARVLAEARAGRVGRAVLSVPVSPAPGYGAALRRAAELAGIGDVALVSEPLAALHGAGRPAPGRVLICDFGGSSFDCAVALGGRALQVAAAGGDGFLGGADFDLALADALAGQVFRATRSDLRNDLLAWTDLVARCEQAKRRLSGAPSTRLEMPDALTRGGSRMAIGVTLERSAVDRLWQPLIDRAVAVTGMVLDRAGVDAQLIDDLLLVGGSNLVPAVRAAFVRRVGRQPSAVVAADVAVAVGAAHIAASR